jgi:hypothetical protein
MKERNYVATGQCCELDEPYQAPVGFFDQPFIYVFDAGSNLPDGQDLRFANITTFTGADFILRRVAGIDRVCTQFQLRDVLARLDFNTPVNSAFRDFVVNPEMLWPSGSGITFDFLPVQKATQQTSGVLLSQVIFQGVRRFKGYKRPPSYPYWEDPFTYNSDTDCTGGATISIDSSWALGETRKFAIPIYNFDFELLYINETIINPVNGGAPCAPGGNNQALKLQLFDQVNEKVFFAPIVDDLIMHNSTRYLGITPVPGIVLRIGQAIQFEVTSLVAPVDECAVQVQLMFYGVRRRPCS